MPDALPAAALPIYLGLGPASRNIGMCLQCLGYFTGDLLMSERKRGRPKTKEKIYRCSEKRYGEVGAKEMDVENRIVWRKMICCG